MTVYICIYIYIYIYIDIYVYIGLGLGCRVAGSGNDLHSIHHYSIRHGIEGL